MKPENARVVANVIVFAAAGALAVAAFRQPAVRRLLFRAVPLMVGGASPVQALAVALAHTAIRARARDHEARV